LGTWTVPVYGVGCSGAATTIKALKIDSRFWCLRYGTDWVSGLQTRATN
jgi:hypothetical protein